jgi:hypothetical protein
MAAARNAVTNRQLQHRGMRVYLPQKTQLLDISRQSRSKIHASHSHGESGLRSEPLVSITMRAAA